MQREMTGIILLALGILGYLALLFPHSGILGRDLGRGLRYFFGFISWIVPLGLILWGFSRLLNRPGLLLGERRGLGALLVIIGLWILLGFGPLATSGLGGYWLYRAVSFATGPIGAAVVAILVGILGLMLLTGQSLISGARIMGQALFHRVLPAGRHVIKRSGTHLRDWLTEETPAPTETPAVKPRTRRPRPVPPAAAPVENREEVVTRVMPVEPADDARWIQPPVFSHGPTPYLPPPFALLQPPSGGRGPERKTAETRAHLLQEALRQFGIEVRLGEVSQGPTITRFEIIPPPGVKVSRIVNLADDIALSLAATGVRIEAPIPGKSAIGIEVPNEEVTPVLLREVLESQAFVEAGSPLTVALGRDVAGSPVVAQLDRMPHLLVAGATGSGKSVLINSLITSLLFRSSPDVVRLLLIDPKVVELSVYNGIPHLIAPVVTEPKKAAGALRWAVAEMERRYRLFAERGVRDIGRYNQLGDELLPLIVVLIDELADLMMVAPADVEESIARLAQMARAAGLHLVVATQRPSVDVITGTIKANIPSRIAFAVSSQIDSRTILDMAGAEKLLGRGDMLFSPVGSAKPLRIQGAFITEKEIEAVVQYLKEHAAPVGESQETPEFSFEGGREAPGDEADPLFLDALRIVVESQQASTSMLQRRMRVGYSRAARLIDAMEQRGYIGPPDGARPREVYITPDRLSQILQEGTSSHGTS